MTPRILPLIGSIKDFSWGSTTLLAQLQNRVPSGRPEAEIWWGTHPGAATQAVTETGPVELSELVTLPYLVKLIAAASPLSLQAHPDKAQAEAGYARETTAGVAPQLRNYKDPNHKPEVIVALTEFRALCGFRPAEDSITTLQTLRDVLPTDHPDFTALNADFDALIAQLNAGDLRSAVSLIIGSESRWGRWVTELARALQTHHDDPALSTFQKIAAHFPANTGAMVCLLMNQVDLEPGQALYIHPTMVHAYLCGLGLELMATSDNVLRGGLTVKHVDAVEFLRIGDFAITDVPYAQQIKDETGTRFFPPVPDFQLLRTDLEAGQEQIFTPEQDLILVGTRGQFTLSADDVSHTFAAGEAALIPKSASPVRFVSASPTTVFVAQAG